MKFWLLRGDGDRFQGLSPVDFPSHEEIQTYDGRPKKDVWVPMEVEKLNPEKDLVFGDLPIMFNTVFSQRGVDVLAPFIEKSAEVLPLIFEEQPFYMINVTTVLDVFDREKSKFTAFKDGRVMWVKKYVFRPCAELWQYDIFKIEDERLGWPFVSDRFKQIAEEHQLKGLVFELAWDSEAEG